MDPQQFQQFKDEIKGHIEVVIQSKVNGKIDKITQKIDNYIAGDEMWKETATPVIKLGTNITGFGIVGAYVLGTLASLTAAWGAIEWVFNIINKSK